MRTILVATFLIASSLALAGAAAAERVTGCATGAGDCFLDDHMPECVVECVPDPIVDPTRYLPKCVVEGPLCG